MNINLLKKVPISLVAFAATASVFAAPDMDTRVHNLEQQMKQVRTETASGTYGAKTATARAEVDGAGVFVNVDVLLWHAKVGGSEYCYTDQDPTATLPVQGQMRSLDFDWDWGFRFGLGYNFEHDGWDAFLNYTYFDTNDSQKTAAGYNGSVIPLKGTPSVTGVDTPLTYVTNASSSFKFDYDNLDLELGRNYFISKSLSFRPHFGLRSTWLDLTQRTNFSGGNVLGDNLLQVYDSNNFWGMGPRAGVNSKWHLSNGFSVVGNVAGSLLYGYYKVQHQENDTTSLSNAININANMHRFSPNAQMFLGLSYDKYIFSDKQHIGIALGWEIQYYWRINQMLTSDDFQVLKYERYSEDAAMYGITLDIRWDF
jgi:hypothetical protein